ncbi:hypothetical protein O0I10_007204 [Lichtheimia ornata]|uniref:Uncharacterized protein n=1 Tax=Lichtheimia ornata TaxID=688661 RepID=A0AAD7XU51_9FUNG|nr:uncharacterized protein O0I10_007204 [Lichtheimia ornata]KAJ8657124.1 hypothetical protein O0I10_007204 [Lichtheimia ornata]
MDLNICLYCEKRLADDNLSFCSLACQAHEASKTHGMFNDPTPSARKNSISSLSSSCTSELSYHRRRSYCFSKNLPNGTPLSCESQPSLLLSGEPIPSSSSTSYMHLFYHFPQQRATAGSSSVADSASTISTSSSTYSMDSVYTNVL